MTGFNLCSLMQLLKVRAKKSLNHRRDIGDPLSQIHCNKSIGKQLIYKNINIQKLHATNVKDFINTVSILFKNAKIFAKIGLRVLLQHPTS